ncbi:Nif11-like leader peptide family natural product precursor [Phormidesmis priestleyi ULC007]|uniref:Nif11-like leader peptide family natural product n=1 Tax=Phormidesmis priestleyi ULC007 TaxID=1920490 RepID=A0A2T1D7U9_9CYAN|nr:Nif11-like leader peptide family natural product precursor [Phormidesmis priestleyi]PSB16497.1 Nif11-like leader peptide family natural product precursor [Phormidesmis priestleyi ULC007]PZO48562.1 MAG: Nif11-like leader peptide family natural product precursor [Phormidesmis priestleyi]
MSVESATRFLTVAAQDHIIREKFSAANSPEEFLKISNQLGYCFTIAELKQLIRESSQDVGVRRSTGVWKWLRNVNWLERANETSRDEGEQEVAEA